MFQRDHFKDITKFKRKLAMFGGLMIVTISLGAVVVLIALNRLEAPSLVLQGLGFALATLLTVAGILARDLIKSTDNLYRNEEKAQHGARYDTITGLVNRPYFKDILEITANEADGQSGILAIVELENFKSINDSFGFTTGNALLKAAATVALKHLPQSDLVSRIGGDEFAVFRKGPATESAIENLNADIRRAFSDAIQYDDQRSVLSLSIGICAVNEPMWNANDVLRKTEIALFHAKAEGKQRTRVFNAQMDIDTKRTYRLDNELRGALANKQLSMVYQPLICSQTGDILSVEALMRWHSPVLGNVSPGEFIPLAERNGQILELGKFAMRQACTDALKWPGIDISINVSAIQIKHSNFVEDVKAIVDEIGIDPKRVEIEITEGVMLDDNERLRAVLLDLKDYGFRIALDDFGTGYSSLGYLQSFAFDTLKIDRSFVKNIGRSLDTNTIVYSVTAMGRSLGMVIVAEGVETEDQAAFLKAGLCDLFQGFLFSKPLEAADLTQRIVSREKLYMAG